MQPKGIFPFGQLVKSCQPQITEQREIYILGAYPSALHVLWNPPQPFRPVRAIAVDNEPQIFWNGVGELEYFNTWKSKSNYRGAWGTVSPATNLNGTSGIWVDKNVIERFGLKRDKVWLSDCLDTYRCSSALAKRIENTYARLPKDLDLPQAFLFGHPSEAQIVAEAREKQLDRLSKELETARPDKIVTLGNAALRVLSKIVQIDSESPKTLSADPLSYGKSIAGRTNSGHLFRWFPLAHPAAPRSYQQTHIAWQPR